MVTSSEQWNKTILEFIFFVLDNWTLCWSFEFGKYGKLSDVNFFYLSLTSIAEHPGI